MAVRSSSLDDAERRHRLRRFAVTHWGEGWLGASIDAIERRLLNALVKGGDDDPTGEPTTSLATCEKVPTSRGGEGGTGRSIPETADEVGVVSDATEVIRESLSRERPRQRKAIELIKQGEVAHAKRLVTCGRKSVELACGDCEGINYVPLHCDSPLCPDCGKRKMGRVAGRYAGVVNGWDHPTMLRLSLPSRTDPAVDEVDRAVDALRGAFGRLRRRVVPTSGDGWEWKEWKRSLRMMGKRRLAARWEAKYASEGRGIPFEEIVRSGFYAVDVKQKEDGRLNIHLHVLADVPFLPQAALSELWDDLIGAPVVDIRRVDGRGEKDMEKAVVEAVGYAAKAPEYQETADEVAYFRALKGSKLVQPFGELHGNTPPTDPLRCGECEGVPMLGWEYLGVVDEQPGMVGSSADGDRPPDGEGRGPAGGWGPA